MLPLVMGRQIKKANNAANKMKYNTIRHIVITYETHCDIRHWNIDTHVVLHVVVVFSLCSSSIDDSSPWCMYPLGGIHS